MEAKQNDIIPAEELNRRFIRNMDWNLLKIFNEIVRNDGITNAANALSRQQPSVSSALKRLEEYLDKTLCERGPAGFSLTDHGERLFEICEKIDQLVNTLQPEFDELDNDISVDVPLVAVGSIVSERLDRAIKRFGKKSPRATLTIDIAPWPEIEQRIVSGKADIGICPAPRELEGLNYTYLCTEKHLPVCGRPHQMFSKRIRDRRDLVGEAFVIPGKDEAAHILGFREEHGWGNNTSGKSHDLVEVRRMVLAGIGIALLPFEFVQSDLDTGDLWPLMNPIQELSDDVFVVSNTNSPRYWISQKFSELLPEPE